MKLRKFGTIESIRKSNVNVEPCLYSSAIKLLKLEQTQLNAGL